MSVSITARFDHSALRLFSDSKLQLIESGASHLPVNTTPGTEDISWNQCVLTAQPLSHNFSKAWDSVSFVELSDIRVSHKPHSHSEQAHKRRLAKNINQATGRGIAPLCNAKEIMNSNGHSSSGRKWKMIWLLVLWGPECKQQNQNVGPFKQSLRSGIYW